MIRAIVWKELREQGLIGLTLVVLGGGLLVAAATLADPPAPGARRPTWSATSASACSPP